MKTCFLLDAKTMVQFSCVVSADQRLCFRSIDQKFSTMAIQSGLCQGQTDTSKTGFLMMWLILLSNPTR